MVKQLNWRKRLLLKMFQGYVILGGVLLVVALVLMAIPLFPSIYYSLNVQATNDEVIALTESIVAEENKQRLLRKLGESIKDSSDTAIEMIPQVNPSLPQGQFLKIPKIGVDTEIIESNNPQEALYNGVWRENMFSMPMESGPMVLAAHRYGYLRWSSDFRKKSSFYNLPKLNPGDRIEVWWEQREFVYEVYEVEEAELLTNFQADLILYTCKYMKSPVRIFVYARLVK